MGKFDGKFESGSQEWETPQWLFDVLNIGFNFSCDVAADEDNTKCVKFMDENLDALTQNWEGVCWMNPPYGQVGKWVKKAFNEFQKGGTTIVALIPARTNTIWWHDYCMGASAIHFIKGRVKFSDAKHGLPQPLAIVIFDRMAIGRDTIYATFDIKIKKKRLLDWKNKK